MKLPDRYNEVRESLPSTEVSFGCGGIKLFSLAEIENGQLGYSVAPDGRSLCSGETGAWQPNWVVIGYETACGDPLFIDIRGAALPVFTAIHGEGAWEPVQVVHLSKRLRSVLESSPGPFHTTKPKGNLRGT